MTAETTRQGTPGFTVTRTLAAPLLALGLLLAAIGMSQPAAAFAPGHNGAYGQQDQGGPKLIQAGFKKGHGKFFFKKGFKHHGKGFYKKGFKHRGFKKGIFFGKPYHGFHGKHFKPHYKHGKFKHRG